MGLKKEFLKAKWNKISNSAFSPIRHSRFWHSVQFGIKDFGIQEFIINFNWAYNNSGLSPIFQSAEHIYEKREGSGSGRPSKDMMIRIRILIPNIDFFV
jgi:hypothetical protein